MTCLFGGVNDVRGVGGSGNHDIMAVQSYVTVLFYGSNSQICFQFLPHHTAWLSPKESLAR